MTEHATTRMPRLQSARVAVAMEARQIYTVFQPIIDLRAQETFGYEVLVRCEQPELASPLNLLAAAGSEGELGRLGREIRRLALAAALDAPLFLNIHPDELDEPYLAQPDDPIFFHHHPVYLEVTEAAPLTRYRFGSSIIAELRGRGVRVAIDDFGAGYSNLLCLAQLAPDVVKLDRELVAGAEVGSRQFKLLASLARLCSAQGAVTVAEGIETDAELEACMEAGIVLGQGYLLGRPARAEDLPLR